MFLLGPATITFLPLAAGPSARPIVGTPTFSTPTHRRHAGIPHSRSAPAGQSDDSARTGARESAREKENTTAVTHLSPFAGSPHLLCMCGLSLRCALVCVDCWLLRVRPMYACQQHLGVDERVDLGRKHDGWLQGGNGVAVRFRHEGAARSLAHEQEQEQAQSRSDMRGKSSKPLHEGTIATAYRRGRGVARRGLLER